MTTTVFRPYAYNTMYGMLNHNCMKIEINAEVLVGTGQLNVIAALTDISPVIMSIKGNGIDSQSPTSEQLFLSSAITFN